jgi:hypothetical protein
MTSPSAYDFSSLYGQADMTGQTFVPKGTYDAVVEKNEFGRSKDGTKGQWTPKFRITTGPHAASSVTTSITISPENEKALGIMFRHLGAMGVPIPDAYGQRPGWWQLGWTEEQVAQATVGKPVQLQIIEDEYDGAPRSKVRDIKPPRPGAPTDWPRGGQQQQGGYAPTYGYQPQPGQPPQGAPQQPYGQSPQQAPQTGYQQQPWEAQQQPPQAPPADPWAQQQQAPQGQPWQPQQGQGAPQGGYQAGPPAGGQPPAQSPPWGGAPAGPVPPQGGQFDPAYGQQQAPPPFQPQGGFAQPGPEQFTMAGQAAPGQAPAGANGQAGQQQAPPAGPPQPPWAQ